VRKLLLSVCTLSENLLQRVGFYLWFNVCLSKYEKYSNMSGYCSKWVLPLYTYAIERFWFKDFYLSIATVYVPAADPSNTPRFSSWQQLCWRTLCTCKWYYKREHKSSIKEITKREGWEFSASGGYEARPRLWSSARP
jgi:hypothetical protein